MWLQDCFIVKVEHQTKMPLNMFFQFKIDRNVQRSIQIPLTKKENVSKRNQPLRKALKEFKRVQSFYLERVFVQKNLNRELNSYVSIYNKTHY